MAGALLFLALEAPADGIGTRNLGIHASKKRRVWCGLKKLRMETKDQTQTNIEQIAKLFPQVITEMKGEDGHADHNL